MKKDIQVTLRLTSEEHERWLATAESQGVALATWIRQQCNGVAVSEELIEAVAKKLEVRAQIRAGLDRIARGPDALAAMEAVKIEVDQIAKKKRPAKKGGR